MHSVKRLPGASDGRQQKLGAWKRRKKAGGDDIDMYQRVGKSNKRCSGMRLRRVNK